MTYTNKDVEELIASAKENDIVLSIEDAEKILSGAQDALSDEDLKQVSGGGVASQACSTLQKNDRVIILDSSHKGRIYWFMGYRTKGELYTVVTDSRNYVLAYLSNLRKI